MMQESQFFMATISAANLARDNDRLLILIPEAGAPEATDFICLIFYVHRFHCVSRLVASKRERPRSPTYKEIGSAEFHKKSNGLVVGELHDALVPLVQKGELEQTDDALRIELTRERFGNLVAFRIGRSPKRFWCWERAIRWRS